MEKVMDYNEISAEKGMHAIDSQLQKVVIDIQTMYTDGNISYINEYLSQAPDAWWDGVNSARQRFEDKKQDELPLHSGVTDIWIARYHDNDNFDWAIGLYVGLNLGRNITEEISKLAPSRDSQE